MSRLSYLDIAKGLAITAVIIGHQKGLTQEVISFLFSWHLPIFFLIAGYTFKVKPQKQMIAKSFRRLILPYLVICGIRLLHQIITRGIDVLPYQLLAVLWGSGEVRNTVLYFGDMPTVGSIWFLPVMFWTRITYNYISSFRLKYVIAIAIALLSTWIGYKVISLPTGIIEGLSAMLFFALGDALKDYSAYLYKTRYFIITLGAVCSFLFINTSMLSMCRCWYNNYPLDIVAACFMSWLMIIISKVLDKNKYTSTILQWIGFNSLTILCLHNLETHSINYVKWFHLTNIWYTILPIKIIICIIGTIILGKIRIFREIFAIKPISQFVKKG